MMNYKCTNAECGWEGKSDGIMGTWFSNKSQDISIHCIKCGSDAVKSNYTSVPPTEPGWYWWRLGNYITIHNVFNIDARCINPNSLYISSSNGAPINIEQLPIGEWSERIEPPE